MINNHLNPIRSATRSIVLLFDLVSKLEDKGIMTYSQWKDILWQNVLRKEDEFFAMDEFMNRWFNQND